MVDNEHSILGKAKARREALMAGEEQLALVTEEIFENRVKPELKKIENDFIRILPAFFFPLIEEVKQFIQEREGWTLTTSQRVWFSYDKGDNKLLNFSSDYTQRGWREWDKWDKRKIVKLYENGSFSIIKPSITVELFTATGPKTRQIFSYDGKLSSSLGGKDHYTRNTIEDNSEEQINKFTERIQEALERGDYNFVWIER